VCGVKSIENNGRGTSAGKGGRYFFADVTRLSYSNDDNFALALQGL